MMFILSFFEALLLFWSTSAALAVSSAMGQETTTLEVRAVLADAGPAVGVRLAVFSEPRGSYSLDRFAQAPVTDEQGRARVPLDAKQVSDLRRGRSHYLIANVVGARATLIELGASALRGAPIEIVVPSFGFVRALVSGPDGRAIDGGHAWLVWRTRADAEGHGEGTQSCVEYLRQGQMLSYPLQIGGHVELRFDLQQELEISKLRLPGPSRAGEILELELDARPAPVLTATLVDEMGTPLAHERVELGWSYARAAAPVTDYPFHSSKTLTSDATGRVRWCLEPDFGAEYRLGRFHVAWIPDQVPRATRQHLASRRIARGDLPPILLPGDNDLGNLRLERPPLLVAGRAIDEHGVPVAGATLVVERLRSHGYFVEDSALRAESDARGDFEILMYSGEVDSTLGAATFRLVARCNGYAPSQPLPFVVGRRDLEIALLPTASIEMRLQSSDPELWECLDLELLASAEAQAVRGPVREGTTIFRWQHVPKGSYRLRIRARATGLTICDIERIEVREHGPVRDPRLGPVELDALSKRLRLRVRDEAGALVKSGRVSFPRLAGSGATSIQEGEATFVVPRSASVAALIVAEHARPVLLESCAGDAEVIVRPALRRRVRLQEVPPHEIGAARQQLSARHAEDSPLPREMRIELELPRCSIAEPFDLVLPGPGRYTLKTNDWIVSELPHVSQEWTFDVIEGDEREIALRWRR